MLKDKIIDAIKTVRDPEIPINLYDLGLIYDLDISDDGAVKITMTLTTPNCPVAETMPEHVRRTVAEVDGVSSAKIELVFDPPWSPEGMSDDAKLQLEMMGISWSSPPGGGPAPTSLTVNRSSRSGGKGR